MSAQPAGKKGKKKAKGTTFSLTDFLGDAAPAPVVKNIDWADETEDLDGTDLTYQSSYNNKQILSSLPTGPRSSRTIQVDLSKLPNDPPFTAFVGNLPYEADEQMLSDFFKDLKVMSVRLPEENGRFKGYGYVEFADRQSLADALQHNEETFKNRQIRVDVAGSKNQESRRGNRSYGSQGFGGGGFDGPDVTEGEWRRKPNDEFQPPQSNRGYNRSDSYGRDDRGYGGDRDRGYGGDHGYGGDRGYGRDRGYDKYGGDRDYGHRDRGYDGDRYDRSRGYGGDRGYGGGGSRGYGRDQGYGGDRRYSGERGYGRDQGYGERDRGYSDRDGYGDDRRNGDYGRDRGGYQEDRRSSYNRDYDRERPEHGDRYDVDHRPADKSESHGPPSRPQLKLQPRTKPVEVANAPSERSSAIFGGAKPVDTAARERVIEEKLKHDAESVFQVKDEREWGNKRAPRRSSERSDEGPSSPRRTSRRKSSDKDYRDSSRRLSTSPGRQDDLSDSKGKPHKEYRPAPPPKQNPWSKGPAPPPSSEQNRPAGGTRHPQALAPEEKQEESKKPIVRPAPAPATNPWSRGPPKIAGDSRGEREEAEGDDREDEMNERTPEGADDMSRRTNGSGGDGSEHGKGDSDSGRPQSQDRRLEDKPRRHGDGQKDDVKGPPRKPYYDSRPDYQNEGRRRGDGGSGKRRDGAWNQGRYDGGRDYDRGSRRPHEGDRWNEGLRGEADDDRNESRRVKAANEKRRDSSRDSRPECDRSAGAGQEQDHNKVPRSKKGRAPPELEPEPVVEFVQQSKFSALAIEDDDEVDEGQMTNQEGDGITTGAN